ncbi:hypothetical protein ACFQ0M_11740 [Kitasatospora aburaviensis]
MRADEGIDAAPGSIVVTVGCQEAMFLTARAVRRPAGRAAGRQPLLRGDHRRRRPAGHPGHPVEEGPDGIGTAAVEAAVLAERARGGARARSTWCPTTPTRPETPCRCRPGRSCSRWRRGSTCC